MNKKMYRRTITLIIRRLLLDVIDDQNRYRTLLRFQLQPELLVDRIKKGDCAIGVRCGRRAGRRGTGVYWPDAAILQYIYGAETQRKIPGTIHTCAVQHRSVDVTWREALTPFGTLRHGHVLACDES